MLARVYGYFSSSIPVHLSPTKPDSLQFSLINNRWREDIEYRHRDVPDSLLHSARKIKSTCTRRRLSLIIRPLDLSNAWSLMESIGGASISLEIRPCPPPPRARPSPFSINSLHRRSTTVLPADLRGELLPTDRTNRRGNRLPRNLFRSDWISRGVYHSSTPIGWFNLPSSEWSLVFYPPFD